MICSNRSTPSIQTYNLRTSVRASRISAVVFFVSVIIIAFCRFFGRGCWALTLEDVLGEVCIKGESRDISVQCPSPR